MAVFLSIVEPCLDVLIFNFFSRFIVVYTALFISKSTFVVVFFLYLALVTSIQNNFLFVFTYNEHIVNKSKFRKTHQQFIKNVGCS